MEIKCTITSKDVEKYLEKKGTPVEINRILEIGVAVIERVQASQDVDFVKREMEGMVARMSKDITVFEDTLSETVERLLIKAGDTLNIDVEGSIMNKSKVWLRDELVKIKDGAVESSKNIIDMARTVSKDEISGIEKGIKDTADYFNPDLETSYLGGMKATIIKVQADIEELLNPTNMEGFAFQLNDKIETYFGQNSPVLLSVQSLLSVQKTEFTEQLTKLREEIAQRVGIEDTMEKTAIKGFVFEDDVESILNTLAQANSDIVTRTSLEGKNKKGDFIYEFNIPGEHNRIVIECKDESVGLKPMLKYLDEAMQNRDTGFGLLLTKNSDQLPKAVGEFNFYMGNSMFTSYDYLDIALRWYRMYLQWMGRPKEKGKVNKSEITSAIESINNELKNVANIKTKLTGVTNFVKSENDKISDTAEKIRSGVIIFLNKIEIEIK